MTPPKKPRTKAATKNTVPSAADFVGEKGKAAAPASEQSRGRGRPSKYDPAFAREAGKLCELGATDAQLADFFEVSVSTINLWKVEFPDFSESTVIPKDMANQRVAQSLYRRAMGYEHDEVDIRVVEGQIIQTPIRKYYPPDTAAASLWLRNRDSGNWRDKVDHELTGKDGGAIESNVTLSPSEAYKRLIGGV